MVNWYYAVAAVAVLMRYGYPYKAVFAPPVPVHATGGIVITGASSGIGEHAAATLVGLGYTVFAGVRKQKDADRLKAAYPGIVPLVVDVAKKESLAAAVVAVSTALKADGIMLVALVNNAGVQKDMPIELQTSEADRFNFEVNVFGVLDTTRAFLPLLRKTGPGARIVNTGSMAGITAAPGSASYSASKFAVEGLTDALRMEVQGFGISVSLLQPGYIRSQMGAKAHESSASSYGVTDEQYNLYRFIFEGFFAKDKKLSSSEFAMLPEDSSTPAFVHAITSKNPQTR